MASIWDKLRELFGGGTQDLGPVTLKLLQAWGEAASEYKVRDLAFQAAVGKIARSLAKCEVKTFVKGEERKDADYYRLNVAPNMNQNANAWMQKLVARLLEDNEALVIEVNGNLIIADKFDKQIFAMKPWEFSAVESDEYTFRERYTMNDAMYFRLNNSNIKTLVDGVNASYSKMLGAAMEVHAYAGGVKGVLGMQGMKAGSEEERKVAADILENRMRPLWENRNAVVALPQGFNYQDLMKDKGWETTRDYRAMIDDIYDLTASAFGIPPVLLKGQTVDIGEVLDMYLTDCIEPLAGLIQTEMTRYHYGRKDVKDGARIEVDTSRIKHFDLFEAAGSIEKLIGSGVLTINEMRERLGYKLTDDEVGDKHLITKNFGTAEDVAGEGAGNNEDGGGR